MATLVAQAGEMEAKEEHPLQALAVQALAVQAQEEHLRRAQAVPQRQWNIEAMICGPLTLI